MHLFLHQAGQGAGFAVCGLRQDGQRRLDGVGEVAGLAARALEHVGLPCQHTVEVFGQRPDLQREPALQACGTAFTHVHHGRLERAQRPQPHVNLGQCGQHQQRQQQRQRSGQHAAKACNGLFERACVRRHHQAPTAPGLLGRMHGSLQHQDLHGGRTDALMRMHHARAQAICGQRQRGVP